MDPITARPPTPQVLIHFQPDKLDDSADDSRTPHKYLVLITGSTSVAGKVQITQSVAKELACPYYMGDSLHHSSAKAASVGTTPFSGPNEARYQRMWLSKMTRTGILFPEESKPATDDFKGFGGTSSTSTSRRGSASSISSTSSTAVSHNSLASSRNDFSTGAEAPSTGSNTLFTVSELAKLRQKNPILMVLAHPDLEKWNISAIRKSLSDFRIGVILVPLDQEQDEDEEDDDPPLLQPLDPARLTSFSASFAAMTLPSVKRNTLDQEIKINVETTADVEKTIRDIVVGIKDVIEIEE